MRIGAAQLAGWRARLTTHDGDIADGLLEAVAPLRELVGAVAAGRRRLAARHALVLEQKLSAMPRHEQHGAAASDEVRAVAARLRRLAGT